MHYFPIALPFLFLFALLLLLVFAAVEVGILRYAYHRIGIGSRHMFLLLVLSFVGSSINIPIWQLPPQALHSGGVISFHGMHLVVPFIQKGQGTIIAINVGGAIIPAVLSFYLIIKRRLLLGSLIGVSIVSGFVHLLAQPVPGVGIAIPTYIPPIIAALAGFILSRQNGPSLAYISGSMGTLIGADLLNLHNLRSLGAPVVSIGGAGTFDGIFMTGILAVLLAGLFYKESSSDRYSS